eukprot:TRINITY_DN60802_c0_g1_i1.p1 TRINITY_DN60802_c0_g1~~TRINITY_DN60802_c0_g1_i1.p1  ORF type:complete len:439 (+),score=83.26 TRINITY_DN60802_c0_g1_i1:80-1396(+)
MQGMAAARRGAEPPWAGQGRRNRRIGTYDVLARIGEGAFGTVWEAAPARDRRDRTPPPARLALKQQHFETLDEANRYLREALTMARLQAHPNIVPCEDTFLHRQGAEFSVCIVMPLYPEGDISPLCRDRGAGALAAARVASHIGSALAHVHGNSMTHRDVKPQNILSTDRRTRFLLSDFGLCCPSAAERRGRAGTLFFMSPEAVRGGRGAGPPADMWALGAVLMLICGGATVAALPPPHRHCEENPAGFAAAVSGLAAALSPLSPDLAAAAADCLRVAPAERPESRRLAAAAADVSGARRMRRSASAPAASPRLPGGWCIVDSDIPAASMAPERPPAWLCKRHGTLIRVASARVSGEWGYLGISRVVYARLWWHAHGKHSRTVTQGSEAACQAAWERLEQRPGGLSRLTARDLDAVQNEFPSLAHNLGRAFWRRLTGP